MSPSSQSNPNVAAEGPARVAGGWRRFLRPVVWFAAPAAHWVETGAWASALWALTLQWTLAASAFVALGQGLGSPILITSLWCVAQSLLAVAFRPVQVTASEAWPAGVLMTFVAVTSFACLVLLGLGWSSLTLTWLESDETGQMPSGLIALRPLEDSAPGLGDLVVATCPNGGGPALGRVVALPGETYWQRGERVCFPSSGCLPTRRLLDDSSATETALSLEVLADSFSVISGDESQRDIGGAPIRLGGSEVAVRVLNGPENCGPVERITLDGIGGRVQFWHAGL